MDLRDIFTKAEIILNGESTEWGFKTPFTNFPIRNIFAFDIQPSSGKISSM